MRRLSIRHRRPPTRPPASEAPVPAADAASVIPSPGATGSSDMSLVVRSTNAPIRWPNTVLQAFEVEHPSLSSDESVILSPPRGTRIGDPYLGRRLGDFELDELVSAGKLIRIYRGRQSSLQRRVAVKVITDPNMSAGRLQQTRREAGALARLNHPNILTVIAFGAEAGFCWIAMEHADGGSVADWLQGGAAPWPTGYWWLRQALSGLQAAHAAGVVHRHLNPHNLMLRQSGTIAYRRFRQRPPLGRPDRPGQPSRRRRVVRVRRPRTGSGNRGGRTDGPVPARGGVLPRLLGPVAVLGSPPHEMLQEHRMKRRCRWSRPPRRFRCRCAASAADREGRFPPNFAIKSAATALADLEGCEKFNLLAVKAHSGVFRPMPAGAGAGS